MASIKCLHRKPTSFSKPRLFILLSMASSLLISFLSLSLFFSLSSSSRHKHLHPSQQQQIPQIDLACKATRYPETCKQYLTQSHKVPPNPSPSQMIQSAIWVSYQNLNSAKSMVNIILHSSSDSQNRSRAATTCLQILDYSGKRSQSASDALPVRRIKDARAWYSAALSYQSRGA